MNIYEIIYKDEEKQWVAANTNIEALEEVISIEDTDLSMMLEIVELPESKLDELSVTNSEYDEDDESDWESLTFRQFLSQECKNRAKIIASTFYDL